MGRLGTIILDQILALAMDFGYKMQKKNIEFTTCTDTDEMISLGIKGAPALQFEDGKILNFTDAVRWVNEV